MKLTEKVVTETAINTVSTASFPSYPVAAVFRVTRQGRQVLLGGRYLPGA